MIPHGTRLAALMSLVLIFIGCGGHSPRPPLMLGPPDLASALKCSSWTDPEKRRAGVVESWEPTPGLEGIGVIIHVMLASVDSVDREKEYKKKFLDRRRWAIAPVDNAVRSSVEIQVEAGEPAIWIEYWTPRTIGEFFGRNGRVNEIWRHNHIQLTLLGVEDCTYQPWDLRPDGLMRDSMPTPQTSTPWTSQLFRSISRLFTERDPNVLHVFLWWSLAEGDIDGVDAVLGTHMRGGTKVWGYSRSAARGGPAIWVGAYACLTHTSSQSIDETHGRCARVIAHEVGHSLGLHHVDLPEDNLMFFDPEKGVALSESQKQQALREAREQFRPQ